MSDFSNTSISINTIKNNKDLKNKVSVLWHLFHKNIMGGRGIKHFASYFFLVTELNLEHFDCYFKRFFFKPNKNQIDRYVNKSKNQLHSWEQKTPVAALLFTKENFKYVLNMIKFHDFDVNYMIDDFKEDNYNFELIPLNSEYYLNGHFCKTPYNIYSP